WTIGLTRTTGATVPSRTPIRHTGVQPWWRLSQQYWSWPLLASCTSVLVLHVPISTRGRKKRQGFPPSSPCRRHPGSVLHPERFHPRPYWAPGLTRTLWSTQE